MMDPADYPLWNSPAMSAYLKTVSPGDMIVAGEGVRVRDANGRWLLDARSGLWNVTLGYSDQRIIDAMKNQLDVLPYANQIGYGRPSAISMDAANALVPHLPPSLNKIRYCSNGSQAVETAVLLSRFLHRTRGETQRSAVFGMWRGFHGLGAGGGALTGIPSVHTQSGPLLPDVHHAPGPFESYGAADVSDLQRVMTDYGADRVAAVVVEPVVGEGGHVLSAEYLQSLSRFCRANGIHFIVDEVTTGMGRTGAFTRVGQLGVEPDLLTLGKGLTSGYAPLSAVVLSDAIYDQVLRLPYTAQLYVGSTNDGHPLSLAASMAVVDILTQDNLLDNVLARGAQLHRRLTECAAQHPRISAIRGTGLMYAVEIGDADGTPAEEAVTNHLRMAMEQEGVLVSTLALWPAVMIIPPLVSTEDDIDEIAGAFEKALDNPLLSP